MPLSSVALAYGGEPTLKYTNVTFGTEERLVASGTATLDVQWDVAFSTAGSLTRAHFGSTDFVDVVWT
jgi:hypothetical protein